MEAATMAADLLGILGTVVLVVIQLVCLYYISNTAYNIRLHAINEYGRIIHEFDPWFNFRATQYLADNGWTALCSCLRLSTRALTHTRIHTHAHAHTDLAHTHSHTQTHTRARARNCRVHKQAKDPGTEGWFAEHTRKNSSVPSYSSWLKDHGLAREDLVRHARTEVREWGPGASETEPGKTREHKIRPG